MTDPPEMLNELLSQYQEKEVDEFRSVLTQRGWSLWFAALKALEETELQAATSADSPQEAYASIQQVKGIRKVLGLVPQILNRGENKNGRENDYNEPIRPKLTGRRAFAGWGDSDEAGAPTGSAAGWNGYDSEPPASDLGPELTRRYHDSRAADVEQPKVAGEDSEGS